MIKSKRYNNIPQNIIPKLKRGEVVHYRSLFNTVDPFGNHVTPEYTVPPTCPIRVGEDYHEIAYVLSPGHGENPVETFGFIVLSEENRGILTLKGDSSEDAAIYEYIELCSYNKDSKYRVPNIAPIFERIDIAKAQRHKLDSAKLDAEAYNFAMNTKIEEVKAALSSRNINVKNWTDDTIRLKAIEAYKQKPFDLENDGEKLRIEAVINELTDAGLLTYQRGKQKGEYSGFMLDGEKLMKLHWNVPEGDRGAKLVVYLMENPDDLERMVDKLS